jgi:hypothetical protein
MTAKHRIYTMTFSSVYPHLVAKAEKKGRTKEEVDQIIRWLTGYTPKKLASQIEKRVNLEEFFAQAPKLHPARQSITGVICGVRIEEIEDPLMREVRYLDKLIDELAKGRPMEKILRAESASPTAEAPQKTAAKKTPAKKTPAKTAKKTPAKAQVQAKAKAKATK